MVDELTHWPSMVARTMTLTGLPSRLALAMSFQAACGRVTPQPLLVPLRTSGTAAHSVSTRTSVIPFSKSTSYSVAFAGGTNCTSSTFMFGGNSVPSSG